MSRTRRSMAVPMVETTTEHGGDDPIYRKACQDVIDQFQWVGSGQPPLPEKVICHRWPDEENVKHIWKKGD